METHKSNLDFLKNAQISNAHSVADNYLLIMNQTNYFFISDEQRELIY